MVAGFVLSFAEADRDWARWIAYQAGDLGAPIELGLPVGSNREAELRRLLDAGYRVIAVMSPASVTEPEVVAEWRWALAADPDGAGRRLLPVVVAPCEAPEFAALTPLRLHGTGDEAAAADRLRVALGLPSVDATPPAFPGARDAVAGSLTRVGQLIAEPPNRADQVLLPTDDPLPRLRRLSDQARADAGNPGPVTGKADAFGTGLYVTRDVEQVLLDALTSDAAIPHVVKGDAGAGKTSLLWGIATRLLTRPGHEVFLLKATWLRTAAAEPVAVDAALIAAALARVDGASTVLVDTADLVVRDEEDRVAFVSAVDAAIHGGASVLVTSRPAEAQFLPSGWHRIPLREYNRESPDGLVPSEFERAVASHSRVYSPSAKSGREMAERLIAAVARRQPLERLCLRPLTLRMLFELYAPSTVPDHVDVTGLYDAYWRDRVVRDRRNWAPELSERDPDRDEDLTSTAMSLARQMLRAGSPEVPVPRAFDPAEAGRLRKAVDLLVRRGVGEFVRLGPIDGFRFFHQTFFEFAAAQAMLEARRASALELVGQRARAHADDYLLLAIFEQTWLCAWRDEALGAAAENLASRLLDELIADLETAGRARLPYSLQRTVLAVVAQSPRLPDACRVKFAAVLEKASLPAVRDALAVMPPPQREWTAADSDVLVRCAGRDDAAWVSVVNVVRRLVHTDAGLALTTTRLLDPAARASEMPVEELVAHPEPAGLLVDLLPHDPGGVLRDLERFCRVVIAGRASGYLASVLRAVLDTVTDLPAARVAGWFDAILDRPEDRQQGVVLLHAEAHRRRVSERAATDGWEPAVAELGEVLQAIAGNTAVSPRDGARLGGLLTALAEHGPAATDAPVAEALKAHSEPHLLAELHRGWLVGYTRRSPNEMLRAWEDWLVEGLPASHRKPETPAQRWADTIRRTLERPDVPSGIAAALAAGVAQRRAGSQPEPWLVADELLRLVVRAAGAGVPEARAGLRKFGPGPEFDGAGLRSVLQQAVTGDASPAEIRELLDVLPRLGEAGYLGQLIEHQPGIDQTELRARGEAFWALITECLGSRRLAKRRDGARLLHLLVLRSVLPQPEFGAVERFLTDSRDVAVRRSMIGVFETGLQNESYSAGRVREVLGRLIPSAPSSETMTVDVQEARAVLVVAIAKWGSPDEAGELLDLAFREPVSSIVLAKASSFTRAAHRRGEHRAQLPAADFLIEFGVRLRDVLNRARKDTAVRWRGAVAEVVARSEVGDLLSLLDALVRIEERFAESIVLQLEPLRHPRVRERMNDLLDEPALGDLVRRALRTSLAEKSRHGASYSWPELGAGDAPVDPFERKLAEPVDGESFDIAVSFCGSQRDYVKQLVQACQRRGVRVFYDEDHTVRLWGKNFIYEMRDVYGGNRARHFVPVISHDYFTAPYPRDEFDAASRLALERPDDDYIWPIVVGEVTIPARLLSPAIAYLRAGDHTVDELAEIIAGRVRPLPEAGEASSAPE